MVYAFWDQEETGLNGSKYYAGWSFSNRKKIMGVINLDMLGWDGNSDGLAEIHTRNYNYPAVLLIEARNGGDFNPYYHNTSVRFSVLNLSYFHRMVKLAMAGLSFYVTGIINTQRIALTIFE